MFRFHPFLPHCVLDDIIRVIHKDVSGWWTGELNGAKVRFQVDGTRNVFMGIKWSIFTGFNFSTAQVRPQLNVPQYPFLALFNPRNSPSRVAGAIS